MKRIYFFHTLALRAVLFTTLRYVSTSEYDVSIPCSKAQTCSDCIKTSRSCTWCMADGYSLPNRCDIRSKLVNNGCNQSEIFDPDNEMQILHNYTLQKNGVGELSEIQLKPQKVNMTIRPNVPQSITVQFKQLIDYPLDLYILMDLSGSMEIHRLKLITLGGKLANELEAITKNSHIGFGSFRDKPTPPFGETSDYEFKNHMKLRKDLQNFNVSVKNAAKAYGGKDEPEGGFDAIMQSIICKQQIGWRKKSRKLLVFVTDSGFHLAGDGKIAGIVKPNNESCHLDASESYTESLNQDYPSIAQLNWVLRQNDISVIFAVTKSGLPYYQKLSPLITGSTASELNNDSSNIVDIIKNEYKKIRGSVELKSDAIPDMRISYSSSCLNGTISNTSRCTGLKLGSSIEFDITIEALRCPENSRERNRTIRIYPVGLLDPLVINVNLICECDCEKEWNQKTNFSECNGGIYQCGICSCAGNKYGRNCECNSEDKDPDKDKEACTKDNQICSGRGTCICGVCKCYERFSPGERITGTFCECDNFSCQRPAGKLCSNSGICKCGQCECYEGWKHRINSSACDCKSSNDSCINPITNELCSGHGYCDCGECICRKNFGKYYRGNHCENCITCSNRCGEYRDCVEEKAFGSGSGSTTACTGIPIEVNLVAQLTEQTEGNTLCEFNDRQNCLFKFSYSFVLSGSNELIPIVHVKQTKDCPTSINLPLIISSVIGSVFIAGMTMIMLWKLATTIHDKREYSKFVKERAKGTWAIEENPLYKETATTIQNPAFGMEE